ncbi:MAG: 5-formyltetrahydrofolate cyclo-ligase [Usitatibacter sp.]
MDKAELRRAMIARRDAIAPRERARLAGHFAESLAAMPQYRDARTILATMSIGSELDTRPFIDRAVADGKTIVLPRVTPPPRRLEIRAVRDLAADLVAGVWDIPEPDPARCAPVELADVDFAWIPALAVDRAHYRLGYGAGYFDGLLAGRGRRPFCVAALPAQFHVEALPREAHDVPLDAAISEASP